MGHVPHFSISSHVPCEVNIKEEPLISDSCLFTNPETIENEDEDNSEIVKEEEIKTKGRFPCSYCGLVFNLSSNMNTHMWSKHVDNDGNLRKIKCKECNNTYANVLKLRRHQTGTWPMSSLRKVSCLFIFRKTDSCLFTIWT